jgi:flagellar hook-associated protein 2
VDTDAIRTKLTALLTAYNESYTYVSSKIAIDRSTYKRGPLASDSSYSSLWQRMRLAVAGPISTSGDVNFGALSQVGITSSKDGSFSISDPGKFDAALKGDLETVVKMFTSEDGVATRLEKLLGEYVLGEGVISRSSTSVRTQQKILDDRIARMQSLQELERDRLIEQYAAIQQAQASQSGLLTMLSNLSMYLSS